MQITVTGSHVEITESMSNYVSAKIKKMERHLGEDVRVKAILSVDNRDRKAEVSFVLRGKPVFTSATAEDMYVAIDLMVDKLDRQIVKVKSKRRKNDRKNISSMINDE